MQIELARTAGFCFGVQRAVDMAMELAEQGGGYTLGPLAHNKALLARLESLGIHAADSPEEIPDGAAVLIRAHGTAPEVQERLRARGLRVLDATCPCVARIHRIAEEESAAGRTLMLIGEADHPEVQGTCGHSRDTLVFSDETALISWLSSADRSQIPLSVAAQTTTTQEIWNSCINRLKKECTNVKIFDTICNATAIRQSEAHRIAAGADVTLVIGDRQSSNTRKLAKIAQSLCRRVYCVEDAGGLPPGLLAGARTVGVTAGASTPAWIIKEVMDKMSEELKNTLNSQENPEPIATQAADNAQPAVETEPAAPVAAAELSGEESFAEMLEQSFKTLNNGEKVTGTVTRITPTEVYVDLGVKHAAYIPESELSNDPTYKVEEQLHVGDNVDVVVVRVNDVEGTIMLSKKRLDSEKGWDLIEEAREHKTILEGIVSEENKGGVVVPVKGVRVFIPASQTGLPKETPMSTLVKTPVKLRVTEVNRSRRRVVGSIRAVQTEERRSRSDQLWQTIAIGSEYTGTVKSLTSYGAFVDIGGVDGMVHISELSWNRVRHPSEVVSVGNTVDVFVIGLDHEKKKISLGYRRAQDNPWNRFISQYQIGDVATVKVLKFMPFGAFAEVLPGVDGLIHISQIADHRIAKPDDVLQEGQIVDVKITDIDMDRQKISLSIRALLDDGHYESEQE